MHVASIAHLPDKLGYVTRYKPTLESVIDHTPWNIRYDVGQYIHRFPNQAANTNDWQAWTDLFNWIMRRPVQEDGNDGASIPKPT